MKESIFKVGDKVFDYRYGWGEVKNVTPEEIYNVYVLFEKRGVLYTFDGRYNESSAPTLSLTEYTLEGFSQERPSLADELIDRLDKAYPGFSRIESIVIHKFFEEKGL